jgi:hypothetical protein
VGSAMQSPIVRGSPYTSMIYTRSTPRIFAERAMTHSRLSTVEVDPEGDGDGDGDKKKTLLCGTEDGVFGESVMVERELRVSFDASDMTWLIFVSEPTEFECSNVVRDHSLDPPSAVGIPMLSDPAHADHFDLRAVRPMEKGMVRVAMGNNCTTGQNPQCEYTHTHTHTRTHIYTHIHTHTHTHIHTHTQCTLYSTHALLSALCRLSPHPPHCLPVLQLTISCSIPLIPSYPLPSSPPQTAKNTPPTTRPSTSPSYAHMQKSTPPHRQTSSSPSLSAARRRRSCS